MKADGSYVRVDREGVAAFSAQDFFIEVAEGKADTGDIPKQQASHVEPATRPVRQLKKRTAVTAAAD